MNEQYLIYTILDPRPEDAPHLRRMWAIVRRQGGRLYDFRRRLAHDYKLAKCAGKEVKDGNIRHLANK